MLTEGAKGMKGAIKSRRNCRQQSEKYLLLQQFSNPANPGNSRKNHQSEIWEDTDGQVDVFIAGVRTGGTLTGVSRYIKAPRQDRSYLCRRWANRFSSYRPGAGEVKRLNWSAKIQGIGAGLSRLTLISSWSTKSLASPMKKPFLPHVV